jgi:tRNA pseudouridine32 synthase / 23S rRNA pseudouridine746 synthase
MWPDLAPREHCRPLKSHAHSALRPEPLVVTTGFTTLHEDAHLLVLDKPAGLLCVPGRGPDKQDCLSARAQARWPDALVVHRLDMATSGIVVMARGIEAQRNLSAAFAKRQVHKRYTAVVVGELPNPVSGNGWNRIELPLAADWLDRPRSVVCEQTGKPSLTRWRLDTEAALRSTIPGTTRLELEPLTGRSHQLRVHLMAIGHPIVGDPLYASAEQQALSPRLLLHAQTLEIAHPVSASMLRFECACPF